MKRVLFACLAAAACTLTLNASGLQQWMEGTLTTESLAEHGIDERYYFATIGKVGMGEPALGHSSFYEHRANAPSTSLAPVIEGLAMRLFGLSLPQVALLGDVVFPFLFVFLLALGLTRLLRNSALLSSAVALIVGSDIGTYWFRSANPQLPFLGVAAWFAAVFGLPRQSLLSVALRALAVGALTWLHLVYASFFIIADGLLIFVDAIAEKSPRRFMGHAATYGAILAASLSPRIFLTLPTDVAQDTFYRLGIVIARIPADPKTQLVLLAAIIVLFVYRWFIPRYARSELRATRDDTEALRTCLLILCAALLAYNQALIHGHDATFLSYYAPIVRILIIVTAAALIVDVVRVPVVRRAIFTAAAAATLVALYFSATVQKTQTFAAAEEFQQTDAPKILEWLRELPDTAVIAAPNALNERIPYETRHYVLFNEYGWNQPMTDTELAERYALQVRLVPSSKARDNTYTFVFGGHAGLTAAKRRTFCNLKNKVFRTENDCSIDSRSLIRHQELLPIVDNLEVDIDAAMEKYHVQYVVTEEGQGTEEVAARCEETVWIGAYTGWRCV